MPKTQILESGQTVHLFVEKVLKQEQGCVLTLLQLMVVQIVLGKCLKVDLAYKLTVQVEISFPYLLITI